ncbi:MAG: RNA-directed DNA polymerase [Candidatus Microsyncoccus archaeolyticus]|nr:MAG: RNA-directed DNA polymerase [Candidatus Parcubacteria bacterium]
MKRKGNLFEKICSFENIYLAYLKARKGKKIKRDILEFNYYLEYNLVDIRNSIEKQKYIHGIYKEFMVHDSKKRLIRAPLFKDRTIHHSLCNIIEPIFEKSFIFDSYACRKKKGSHKGIKRLTLFLKDNKEKYCLKCDISKYFDSIDQIILFSLIKKKIKDKKTIWLISQIINSFNKETKIGIPIGNLTSQLFANIYLNELDQFVKHNLKQKRFIRYMDDFLILGKEKRKMHFLKEKIRGFLKNNLKLKLNPKKANVAPLFKGIEFLGYVLFRNYILLRKSTIKRLLKKIKKELIFSSKNHINAWFSYFKHANSFRITKAFLNKLYLY